MELPDRFYSAPEVAEILGVTLRSLYRYIRDGKIETFKTAGGRLRFTKESITAFMGPQIKKAPVYKPSPTLNYEDVEPVAPRRVVRPTPVEMESEVAPVVKRPLYPHAATPRSEAPAESVNPWTARYPRQPEREEETLVKPALATSLYDSDSEEIDEPEEAVVAPKTPEVALRKVYYRSSIRDLRLLAQKIQKSCTNAHVPYALTGYAGMSLHQEMPPFSVIDLYARFDDLPFFENVLQADEVSNSDEANIQFWEVRALEFWQQVESFKGFKVVKMETLEADLGD
jgi:excisionase family DNA binding protein